MHGNTSIKQMSLSEFLEQALEESQEELEEIRKLQEILNQISESRERPQVYIISVTSNL